MKKIIIAFLLIILSLTGVFLINRNNDTELTSEEAQDMTPLKDEGMEDMGEGKQLAGSTTPYREFSKAEYDKAVADGKVIFLNYYANWCPICRAEEPELIKGFNGLENPNVVGFRVNFKDDETDETEGKLALEHKITYQHSKVIIENGDVVYRQIAERWDNQKVKQELSSR